MRPVIARWLSWTEWAACEQRCCRPWHPAAWVAWLVLGGEAVRMAVVGRTAPAAPEPEPAEPEPAPLPAPVVAPTESWCDGGLPAARGPVVPHSVQTIAGIDGYETETQGDRT